MLMHRCLQLAFLVFFTVSFSSAAEQIGGSNAFSFVALGDMPYNLPQDIGKFDRLIAIVNALKPAFTLHVGDTKSSSVPAVTRSSVGFSLNCRLSRVRRLHHRDNEWTHCHRKQAGGFDPRERLTKLRQMFFANPSKSLGQTPIDVESQAQVIPEFSVYVENVRFSSGAKVAANGGKDAASGGGASASKVAAVIGFASGVQDWSVSGNDVAASAEPATGTRSKPLALEPPVLTFLHSRAVLRWAEVTLGL
jgi:hypothetical protein